MTAKTDAIQAENEHNMPVMGHLKELRRRIVNGLIALVIGVAVALVFAEDIHAFLVSPMKDALATREHGAGAMTIIGPLEGVYTYMRIGFYGGLLIASPVVFYQIWSFVAPGLHDKERNLVLPLVFASSLLMLIGGAFGYKVIFKFGFPFFLSILGEGTEANISIASYLSSSTKLLVGFGLCFQLPIVVFFMSRMGFINANDMISKFRYAIVLIFVISALMTPPDPMTQALMAVPMTILYCLSIGVSYLFSTKTENDEE